MLLFENESKGISFVVRIFSDSPILLEFLWHLQVPHHLKKDQGIIVAKRFQQVYICCTSETGMSEFNILFVLLMALFYLYIYGLKIEISQILTLHMV